MTKEELKKEFEKYLKDSADYYDPREPFTDRKLLQLWLDCAEPREKRIADLENKLANVSYQLEGREVELKELQEENEGLRADVQNRLNVEVENIELKRQIEKMKRCSNCKYRDGVGFNEEPCINCSQFDKWELAEN